MLNILYLKLIIGLELIPMPIVKKLRCQKKIWKQYYNVVKIGLVLVNLCKIPSMSKNHRKSNECY
jgi:hypothetical protein